MKANKIFALALAIMMVLALAAPAFAAETTYNITITSKSTGNTYLAYQIFKGDFASITVGENENAVTTKHLSNITWGDGVDSASLIAALKAKDAANFSDGMTAAQVAEGLSKTIITDAGIAEIVAGCLVEGNAIGFGDATGAGPYSYTTTNEVPTGYYFIKQTAAGNSAVTDISKYIIEVIDNVAIAAKETDIPGVEKTADGEKHNSASVGDIINFKITSNVPANIADYNDYIYKLTDTMSDGLAFKSNSVVVSIGGVELTDGSGSSAVQYTVTTPGSNSSTFELEIKDLETYTAGAEIVITYTAELTDTAVAGTPETNDVKLTYSNDPKDSGNPVTVDPPGGETKTYTTDLEISKVEPKDDGTGYKAKDGAGFTLYKMGATDWEVVENGTNTENMMVSGDDTDGYKATFKGLGTGEYKLVESTVPVGYNKMEDVEFTVTFNATSTKFAVTVDDNKIEANPAGTLLTATVKNVKGATLPETGGIGTTIFTILGIVLMAGAAVVLITKKKMSGK